MWWLRRLAACALMIGAFAAFVLGGSDRIPLHARPDSTSPVRTLLTLSVPFEVERVDGLWAEVSQGSIVGWIRTEHLPISRCPNPVGNVSSPIRPAPTLTLDRSALYSDGNSLGSLLKFAVGNRELRMKMRDPSFRDRVVSISSEWGPFYSVRTRHYYVKGICLKRMLNDHVRLALAKRRISYREMFGSLWSDEFLRVVIKSNRGLLGNERLFGKGREYFLELSFSF